MQRVHVKEVQIPPTLSPLHTWPSMLVRLSVYKLQILSGVDCLGDYHAV